MLTPKLIAGIMAFVNAQSELQRTKVALTFDSVCQERHKNLASVSSDYLSCKDDKGNQCMIIGSMCNHGYVFRSVLRRKRKISKTFAWLINGQASTGAEEIAFYGEQLVYVPTTEELEENLTLFYKDSRRAPDIQAIMNTLAHRPQ